MLRFALTAAVLLVSFSVFAKTPGEVYEQAAKSTVVVWNIDASGKAKSMGSGVILPDRDVVTNCHVVKGASQLKVRIGNKEYTARLRYSDWDRDVCSLSVSGLVQQAAVVGSTKTLKVGAKVYAVGAPRGLELTLSDGIVSSLREVDGGRYIQTTAAISPGSSGGGLYDENGALVGLTTFYFAEGQNLNFAVPIEWVKELAQRSTKIATTAQAVAQWLNKSIELEKRKDWPASLEHSKRWTKAQPGNTSAWFSLGFDYGTAGQPTNAIEAYQQVLRINPEFFPAWNNMGVTYREAGQFTKAIDAYQQSLRIYPGVSETWIGLGNTYDMAGQPVKAIEAYQQALRISPEDANAWENLGFAYIKADQSAKAIEAFQQALRINPEDAIAWAGIGLSYAQSGQRDKVLAVYKRLKTLDPVRAEKFFNVAVLP